MTFTSESESQNAPPVPASAFGLSAPVEPDKMPRCWRCRKMLALLVSRPWAIRCVRCKALNGAGDNGDGEQFSASEG